MFQGTCVRGVVAVVALFLLCSAHPDKRPHYSDPMDIPLFPDEPRNHDGGARYSTLRFRTIFGMNVAVGRNICLRSDGGVVLFPAPGHDILPEVLLERLFTKGQYGFRFGWTFYRSREALPSIPWIDATAVVLRPAVSNHIHHFAEAVITLFHAALHKSLSFFSEPDVLLLPTVKRDTELPWNMDFLDVVLAAAASVQGKAHANPRLLFAEDLGTGDLCFDRVALVGMQTSEFGIFADTSEADLFRNFTYKHLDLPSLDLARPRHNSRISTLLLERQTTRKLLNYDATRRILIDTALLNLDFEIGLDSSDDEISNVLIEDEGSFSEVEVLSRAKISKRHKSRLPLHRSFDNSVSFREQVAWMRSTDILIGVHGAGLFNAIFMKPGSVVIDLMCPNFFELPFATAVTSAGSTYMFLPNTNESSGSGYASSIPESCLLGLPSEAQSLECLAVRNCDLEVDVRALEGLARQAAMLVRLQKRKLVRDIALSEPRWQRGRLPNREVEALD